MQKGSRLLTYINSRLRVTIQQECVYQTLPTQPRGAPTFHTHFTHTRTHTQHTLNSPRSRVMEGNFLAFDRHMNIVLGDAEEYRTVRVKKAGGGLEEKEEKRALGLVLVRGTNVVSVQVVKAAPSMKQAAGAVGGGVAKAAGRGAVAVAVAAGGGGAGAAAPMGLSGGPVRGLGGPAPSLMAPPGFVGGMPQGMIMMPPGLPPGMPPGMPGMPPGFPAFPMGMIPPPPPPPPGAR
jgi:small nuclear ribonucleoprotein B and B'